MSFGYTLYLPSLFGSPAPIGPAPGSTHTIQCHAPDLFANSSAPPQFLQVDANVSEESNSFHGVGMAVRPSWVPNPRFVSESSNTLSRPSHSNDEPDLHEQRLEATSSSPSAYRETLPILEALKGLPPAPAEFCVEITSVRFAPSNHPRKGSGKLELLVDGEVVAHNEVLSLESNSEILWTLEQPIFFPAGATLQVKHCSNVGNDGNADERFASLRYQDVRQFWFVDLSQVKLAGNLDVRLGVKVTMGGNAGMRSLRDEI